MLSLNDWHSRCSTLLFQPTLVCAKCTSALSSFKSVVLLTAHLITVEYGPVCVLLIMWWYPYEYILVLKLPHSVFSVLAVYQLYSPSMQTHLSIMWLLKYTSHVYWCKQEADLVYTSLLSSIKKTKTRKSNVEKKGSDVFSCIDKEVKVYWQ